MNWEKIITYAIIGVVVSLTMAYLNKGANKEIKKSIDGALELRMHKLYQIAGYICLGIAIIGLSTALYYQEMVMYFVGAFLVIFFGAFGLASLFYYKNHILRFDDEQIIVQNWKGKTKEIPWKEIEQIKFNPFSGYVKILGLNKKLIVHQHLVGLKTFVQMMEEKTRWKASELKLPIR